MSGIGPPPSYSLETFRKKEGPLIDIRSPKEFIQGHWPGAINMPLFTNEERALVGSAYNKKGRGQAITLGLRIIKPKLLILKETLLEICKCSSNSSLKIYCWRGGMRSKSLGWFANLLKLNPILLNGGYKTYRKWVLNQFEKPWPLKLIGGKTGTGKTSLLLSLANQGFSVIDLEALANHRGSSFGGIGLPPQPSTEQFENLLAEELQSCLLNSHKAILLEAESANLGKCRIPNALYKQMKRSRIIEITREKEERIQALINEYSNLPKEELELAALRIKKRLGPQRTEKAVKAIQKEEWAEACIAMLDYYDKCYEYDLNQTNKIQTIDISGLSYQLAAKKLIKQGYVD